MAVVADEPVENGKVEGQRLARRGATGDDRVSRRWPRRAPRAGASRASRSRWPAGRPPAPAPGRRGVRPVGRWRRLDALGDQAAVRSPGLDRALPARGGGKAGAGAGASHSRRPRVARSCAVAADRGGRAQRVERASVVEPHHLGAVGDGQRRRGRGRPLAFGGRDPALPRARQHCTQEVLSRQRHEQRAAELAQLTETPQDLEVVVDREVEVQARVERDLLLGHAMLERRLDPLPEPALQVDDRIAVPGRLAIGARRALDVHEHVAATRSATRSSIPGSAPPEMSLIAAAPASSARLATSG